MMRRANEITHQLCWSHHCYEAFKPHSRGKGIGRPRYNNGWERLGTGLSKPPVMFLHERGWWMGVYQWAFWSGLMVSQVYSAPLALY